MANGQVLLIVVILASILAFWWICTASEGFRSAGSGLPGSMRPCPKHVWCSCIDEAGEARGSVRLDTEYQGPFKCRVKHQKRACEYCKSTWGSDTNYKFGNCYWNWSGTKLERKHCPGYQKRESCNECFSKCGSDHQCIKECLKTCVT